MEGLEQALAGRILILDGAMGTMLQRYGLSGNSEAFNLSNAQMLELFGPQPEDPLAKKK